MKALHVLLAVPRGADVGEPSPAEFASGDPGLTAIHERLARAAGEPVRRPGAGATAVVIDVLRATTTLTAAFEHGAARVIAAGRIEEALALARAHPGALLCGEREGRIVPGFDLGNSPFEYTRKRVAGKTLVFASTNGSQALQLAREARRTLLGAFVNASAIVERVAGESEVWLIASGKLGEPSLEDVACAGWMARALLALGFEAAGEEVGLATGVAPGEAAGVRALVEGCSHAAMLAAIGPVFVRDIAHCATLDATAAAFEI